VTLKAFTLAGLNAAYNLNDTMTLTVRGENLLDEDYQEVVGYASQGRGVYAGLRARFD
jgi:vitamin B12 transporter